jgi:hypothetical protein
MRPYVVRQGDHLPRLAARMGFDAEEVWNHERNRGLRERGRTPEMLAPGDVLFVPEAPRVVRHRISPGASHRFSGQPRTLTLRFAPRIGASALPNERVIVEGLGAPIETSTDGEGVVTFEAPVDVAEVDVVLPDRARRFSLRVGHLDPIEESSGVEQRLAHLGFLLPLEVAARGSMHGPMRTDEYRRHRVARAIACFQRKNGLPATGALDDDTRRALRDAHGA